MSEVNYNANQGENQESAYDSANLLVSDVEDICRWFSSPFEAAVSPLNEVAQGFNLESADSKMEVARENLVNGAHVLFAMRNYWLKNPEDRQKFVSTPTRQNPKDVQAVLDLYDVIVASEDLRNRIFAFLNEVWTTRLRDAYKGIRYDAYMQEWVNTDDFKMIMNAFREFDEVYSQFNHANIYKKYPLSKSEMSQDELVYAVKGCMIEEIAKYPNLHKFIGGPTTVYPNYCNYLRSIDKETYSFSSFGSHYQDLKKDAETCGEFLKEIYQLSTKRIECLYLAGLTRCLQQIQTIFETGYEVLEAHHTRSSEAPYCCLHYPNVVKDTVSKYSLWSLSDPIKNGTEYYEMVTGFAVRLNDLAPSVAKNAPE